MRVGLTGGIAAGKSAAAAALAEHGAVVIDHDELSRQALAPGSPGLAQVRAAFGPAVCTPAGGLDRGALAHAVFADSAQRAVLEGIVHPAVRRAAAELEAAALRADPRAVVVHDVPLLVETGQADQFDLVVVVQAPEAVRVRRLVRGRGMTAEAARTRIAAQATDADRAAVADVVLDGSAGVEHLREQVAELWRRL